ncbi:hypothetical protein FBULB1_3247 [Fusarium bulbicola]|nr:hypothetical protein FBULB1_3247 [Fusarium bulbicola]
MKLHQSLATLWVLVSLSSAAPWSTDGDYAAQNNKWTISCGYTQTGGTVMYTGNQNTLTQCVNLCDTNTGCVYSAGAVAVVVTTSSTSDTPSTTSSDTASYSASTSSAAASTSSAAAWCTDEVYTGSFAQWTISCGYSETGGTIMYSGTLNVLTQCVDVCDSYKDYGCISMSFDNMSGSFTTSSTSSTSTSDESSTSTSDVFTTSSSGAPTSSTSSAPSTSSSAAVCPPSYYTGSQTTWEILCDHDVVGNVLTAQSPMFSVAACAAFCDSTQGCTAANYYPGSFCFHPVSIFVSILDGINVNNYPNVFKFFNIFFNIIYIISNFFNILDIFRLSIIRNSNINVFNIFRTTNNLLIIRIINNPDVFTFNILDNLNLSIIRNSNININSNFIIIIYFYFFGILNVLDTLRIVIITIAVIDIIINSLGIFNTINAINGAVGNLNISHLIIRNISNTRAYYIYDIYLTYLTYNIRNIALNNRIYISLIYITVFINSLNSYQYHLNLNAKQPSYHKHSTIHFFHPIFYD